MGPSNLRRHIGIVSMAGDLEFPDSVKSSMPVEEILSPMSKEVIVLMPEDLQWSLPRPYKRLVTLCRVNSLILDQTQIPASPNRYKI